MPTYKLTVAYDGTDFAGWQKQEPPDPAASAPGGPQHSPIRTDKLEEGLVAGKPGRVALRTVQAVLERAVREVVREPVLVRGASRTDAGVHARSQVAVFACSGERRTDTETESPSEEAGPERAVGNLVHSRATGGWPAERGVDRLLRALNSRLPEDVQVVRAEIVHEGFDPIGECIAKGYSYTFWESMHRPLWERRRVWHTWAALDLGAMRRATAYIVGEHDFNAFAAAGHGRENTVRKVFECTLRELPAEAPGLQGVRSAGAGPGAAEADAARIIRMDISGNGFLYNMVRIIAGTLHEVGRGRIVPERIPEIIAGRNRHLAGPTLPPQGLCLEWIRYQDTSEPRA